MMYLNSRPPGWRLSCSHGSRASLLQGMRLKIFFIVELVHVQLLIG
jgi:hypothetical protein